MSEGGRSALTYIYLACLRDYTISQEFAREFVHGASMDFQWPLVASGWTDSR